jgi:hypothetical protein
VKALSILMISLFSISALAQLDVTDLTHPWNPANPNGMFAQSESQRAQREKDEKAEGEWYKKQCQETAMKAAIDPFKKLTITPVSLPDKNKNYKIALRLCDAGPDSCEHVESSHEFSSSKIDQTVINIPSYYLGCDLNFHGMRLEPGSHSIQVILYEVKPFYTFDSVIGRNMVPVSQLKDHAMLVPVDSKSQAAVRVEMKSP